MPSDTTVTERPDTVRPGGGVLGRARRPGGLRRRVAARAATTAVVLAGVVAGGPSGEASGRAAPRPSTPATTATPAAPVPTTTVPEPVPTTTVPAPAQEPDAPAATLPPRPPDTRSPAPAAVAAPCRDSSDPACGPFRWDPAPAANQPLTVVLEVEPARPRAGEEVTVRVVASDPDAPVTTNGGAYFWDDPYATGAQIGFPYVVDRGPERFGAWTPPAAEEGRLETVFTHTFSQPGTFRFSFAARSGDASDPGDPARHPYAGAAEASVTIVVVPAQEAAAPQA